MLRLRLLGTPQAELDGMPVSFDTRKAMAVLAYLAVTGAPHGRDTLAGLLWPDYEQAKARAALRRTLSVLNTATGGHCLDLDRSGVRLRAEAVTVDVSRFTELADEPAGHDHPGNRSCQRCLVALEAAVTEYGADFLAGFTVRDSPEFDDWRAYQAEGLRGRLATALASLIRARIEAGDLVSAVPDARRWLALDPLHEPAHQELMRLYSWTGQRGAALRQYRDCVRILDRELGVQPLAATVAVYDAVQADRLGPPPKSRPPGPAPTAATPVLEPAPVPEADLPLVGRAEAAASLLAAWHRAGDNGQLATVIGEAGIGKTRLVDELIRTAGARVIVARCHEGESGLAFGTITELLRSAIGSPVLSLDRLPAHGLAEASRLLPEIANLRTGLPTAADIDSPGAQARLFDAVIGLLATAARADPPGLLFVDDVQWADAASIAVLGYLARRLDALGVLLVLAWRPEDVPAAHPLNRIVADARRAGHLTIVEPRRLTADQVRELLEDAALPTKLWDRLYRETEGLPFFVTAFLEALSTSSEGDAVDWSLPGGVRDLLATRLASVLPATGQVLAAAAVLGRVFDLDTLRATSGRSEEETVAAIEEMLAARLVAEVPVEGRPGLQLAGAERRGTAAADGGAYDFSHEGLRRMAYEAAGTARRRLLHGRAANALAGRRDASERPSIIAEHLRLAGRGAEAAEWFWRAAMRARSLYAHTETLGHLEAALALGDRQAQAHEAVGDVLTLLGRYNEALAAYERTAAAVDPNDSRALAVVEHKLAEVHHRQGNWTESETHLQAALELLSHGPDDDALRAQVQADRGLLAHRRGLPETAGELARDALALASAAQDEVSLAQAHDLLGVLALDEGALPQAVEHLGKSLEHAERAGDPPAIIAALNNLARVHAAAGRPREAVEVAARALAIGAEHGDKHRRAALHTNLADLLHATGRRDDAVVELKAAAALFADVDEERLSRPEIWTLAEW